MELERVSLAIEKELLRRFDALLKRGKLGNRSEAMRDLMRRRLVEDEVSEKGEVVATLTLVYDHGQRELTDRLVEAGHHHHARGHRPPRGSRRPAAPRGAGSPGHLRGAAPPGRPRPRPEGREAWAAGC